MAMTTKYGDTTEHSLQKKLSSILIATARTEPFYSLVWFVTYLV